MTTSITAAPSWRTAPATASTSTCSGTSRRTASPSASSTREPTTASSSRSTDATRSTPSTTPTPTPAGVARQTSPHYWTASPPRPTTAATRRNQPSTNGGAIMHARIDNPAVTVPGALQSLQALGTAVRQSDIPATTLYLVELRASQINGCSICVDMHSHELKLAGEPAERINTVTVWRDTPYFTEAERAALALTEAATRLADRPDAVPDDVWDEAARHTTRRNSPRSSSRSRRSTPSTASTRPPGKSPATGHASGSNRASTQSRQPDPEASATARPGGLNPGTVRASGERFTARPSAAGTGNTSSRPIHPWTERSQSSLRVQHGCWGSDRPPACLVRQRGS